jgi:polyisoprenoid-binding protein YceI
VKAAEFLDVQKYPKITFISKKIEPAGKDHWKITGDLTIHGITKEMTLDAEGPTREAKDPWGNVKVGTTATGKFNRKDYGLTWNVPLEAGGVLIGDEVTIHLEVELTKQQAA